VRSFLVPWIVAAKCIAQEALESGVEQAMKKADQKTDRMNEEEYQGRLKSLLNSAFTTQLQPLRSLKTVTKKRRALKKQAAKNSGPTKSGTTACG
jgi:hypothetical protein